jgi:hypothetical protein
LHVTVDAEDVNVTFIAEAETPIAFPASIWAVCATVVLQVCPAQPAPWTEALRAVAFTASARVWYCHIPIDIHASETMTKRSGTPVSVNSSIVEPRRMEVFGDIVTSRAFAPIA